MWATILTDCYAPAHFRELLAAAVVLVPRGNAAALRAAILRLLGDRTLRAQPGGNARALYGETRHLAGAGLRALRTLLP